MMWQRIKGWCKSWVGVVAAAVTAVLFVLAGARASRRQKYAEQAQHQRDILLNDTTKKNLERAGRLQRDVAHHKKLAADARAKAEQALKKMGETDETLDDIADQFNSRRKRVRNTGDSNS